MGIAQFNVHNCHTESQRGRNHDATNKVKELEDTKDGPKDDDYKHTENKQSAEGRDTMVHCHLDVKK